MMRSRLLLLALLLDPAAARAQDCAYRPWAGSITPWVDKTFTQVLGASANYEASIWNNWAYYRSLPTPDPPALTGPQFLSYRFIRETHRPEGEPPRDLVAQYYQRVHAERASDAVISIHGSSVYPDAWFADSLLSLQWGPNYTNFGGSDLYNAGYDVYAPYVTHYGVVNGATRRVAGAYGDEVYAIDLRRVLALYRRVKAQGYRKVHVVGVSYGGLIAVLAAREIGADPARGVVLAVEGWLPSREYVEFGDGSQSNLWHPAWEMSFSPTFTKKEFLNLPPGVQVAYGSCSARTYDRWYALLPSSQVITYTGAHEFLWSVWLEALKRTR